MSIFDFPRLHFQGFARTHAPTGQKSGLVDFSTNTVYMHGQPFDHHRPVSEYHEYLQQIGPRFNTDGQWDENGLFSMAQGWDFGGNGHFAIEAKFVSVQKEPFEIDQNDPLVGRSIDFWGHFNEYLGTTFNRARIFDCDPASNWTTTIMVGQLAFGRQGGSHEVPYMLSAPVEGVQPARWQNFHHIWELPKHCLNSNFQQAAVYQFTVSKAAKDFFWSKQSNLSPAVSLLREAMNQDHVLGLVVQFALSNMSAPMQPDSPSFWELHGTISLWCEGEMSTYPHGRLLTPYKAGHTSSKTLSNLSVQITPQSVSLNMVTAVPCLGRAAKPKSGPLHGIGPKLDLGELELRTVKSHQLVAKIPQQAYQQQAHHLTSGIVDVPLVTVFHDLSDEIEQQGLCIIGTYPNGQSEILVQEEEINLQVDCACLFLEFPNWKSGEDFAIELKVRSFVRGRTAPIKDIYLQQFYNPKALPHLRYDLQLDSATYPSNSQLQIVHFKSGRQDENGEFASTCVISTNEQGCGWLTVRGFTPGTVRVLLSTKPDELPWNSSDLNQAEIAYDNDDHLGFWAGVGSFAVRVLTDDWHLAEVEDEAIDFDLIFKHIFAYYELTSSFMKAEVFSLADQCKVESQARLIWQMCDPRNKDMTYYMPPTRDLSLPKAMLLRRYLNNREQQQLGYIPSLMSTSKSTPSQHTTQTRDQLVVALKHAADLEVALMLQYIYAAYSIPKYATGQEYVHRGLWTPQQLQMACGDGKEVRNFGMRGVLLEIAKEEMIHFLMVNNILMAIGEPFYPAAPDFQELNRLFPLEVDFALEPFNARSLQRFIQFEWPEFLTEDLPNEVASHTTVNGLHSYGSLSELYRQIRTALKTIPNLIVIEKGRAGGEHHLFMREDFNIVHPDYQLQVDDLESALFAIDYIVEQGEGCNSESIKFERSHFQQFQRMAEALAKEQIADTRTGYKVPWNPSYPVLRNPTLFYQNGYSNIVTIPQTRTVMQICNECYFLMMQLMVQHFGFIPNCSLRRSKLMNAALDVMAIMIRPLSELLMTLPSGRRGKTAGPSFQIETLPTYIDPPEIAYQEIALRFQSLSRQAQRCEVIDRLIYETMEFYSKYFQNLIKDPQYTSKSA